MVSKIALAPPREPTPMQLKIMRLAALGLFQREIADELGISRQTVKNHLTCNGNGGWGLYRRIGAKSMTHALWILIRDGYILVDTDDVAKRQYAKLLQGELAKLNGHGNGQTG